MSYSDAPVREKLDTQNLWQQTADAVSAVYDSIDDFPEEEKWETTHKLRYAANELLFLISQALGNTRAATDEYSWSNVRKFTMALRTIYQFAGMQHFIEFDSSIIAAINRQLETIGARVVAGYEQSKRVNIEAFASWHQKYSMWKGMIHEN